MFLKLPFTVSFSVLFFTIQYAIYIYIYIYKIPHIGGPQAFDRVVVLIRVPIGPQC